MRILTLSLIMGLTTLATAQEMYKTRSGVLSQRDLSAKLQQEIYDVEKERYDALVKILEENLLNRYLDEQSRKQGESKETLRKRLLAVDPPSEKELKRFYEANKDMIPYPYASIKWELKDKVMKEKAFVKKRQLLDDIKKSQGFVLTLKAPTPPKFPIKLHADAPYLGRERAALTLVEFGDYTCPYCRKAHTMIKSALKSVGKKVKFVYMDYPLRTAGLGMHLAKGGYCAARQKKFWQYHEQAFTSKSKLSYQFPLAFAQKNKLQVQTFEKCLQSQAATDYVRTSRQKGVDAGMIATPGLYLNGVRISLDDGSEGLVRQIKAAL